MFLGIHNIFISYRTTVSYKNLFLAFQKRIAHNRELLTPSRFHLSPVLRFVRNFTYLSQFEFEKVVTETINSLAEHLEELPEVIASSKDFDISSMNDVITLKLGGSLGTYVINKQAPNQQIWFSSPVSGPRRYSYTESKWLCVRSKEGLHSFLSRELSNLLHCTIDLSQCSYYS